MLISYSKKFIFIHIDKAAGASIQDALRPFASPQPAGSFRKRLVWLGKLNRFGGLYRRLQFSEHVNADVIQQCLPVAVYQAMYKFAFVRNPWDRLVSRYSYLLRLQEHPRHAFVKRMAGFEEYLEWEIRRGKMHQYKYVTDPHGKMIVDLICKYETLHEDFAAVCRRLDVRAELPRLNASPHRDYREFFTPATRELVAREFRRDLELFEYDFDGPRRH